MKEEKKEKIEKPKVKKGGKVVAAKKSVEKKVEKVKEKKDVVIKKEVEGKTEEKPKKAKKGEEVKRVKEGKKVVEKKEKGLKRKKTSEEKEIDKIKDAIKKKKLPVFRGRFGKRWLRRKSKQKWSKWRKPRGIDIKRNREDGRLPNPGFRTERRIRYLHPSGLQERLISNLAELNNVPENSAVRIASTVGRRKKKIIIEEAGKMKLKVLNP